MMARTQRNRHLSDKNDSHHIKGGFPHNASTAVGSWREVRINGEDTWCVRWVETYSCERPREHGIAVELQVGTHKPCEMKHGDDPVEHVQQWNVPVL